MIAYTSFRQTTHRPRSHQRYGVVLIVAMAALAIGSALIATNVHMTLRALQSRKVERDRVQLEFLCRAGMQRCDAQLKRDPSYPGESWIDLEGPTPGARMQVLIAVSASDSAPSASSRSATVIARIAGRSHSPETMQLTRTRTLP
jgi:hypothetical protein